MNIFIAELVHHEYHLLHIGYSDCVDCNNGKITSDNRNIGYQTIPESSQ